MRTPLPLLFAVLLGLGCETETPLPKSPPTSGPTNQVPQAPTPPTQSRGQATPLDCASATGSYSSYGCGLLSSLGNAQMDAAFAQDIARQNEFWGLPTTVNVYYDCDGLNALSFNQHVIIYGYGLFWKLGSEAQDYNVTTGVLAHEFGHQVQFAAGWVYPGPTARARELEADGFGGFYYYLRLGWSSQQIQGDFLSTLSSIGDTNFTDPGHHGTPQERATMGGYGAYLAAYALQQAQPPSYEQLHEAFQQQISTLSEDTRVPEVEAPRMPLEERLRYRPGALMDR